jgi:hypothetical protein
MFRRDEDEAGLARLASWAIRDRARAFRDELAGPWQRDESAPEERVGRWVGLGLAVGALVFGLGLAVISTLSDD